MLKILIIDDEPLIRKGLKLLLPWSKHNMEIAGEASDGKKALEFLKNHEVDLALVDIDMPIMNGITFIKTAQRLYPSLNYVVLSIHTEFEYLQDTLRLGVLDYISKIQLNQENFDPILERIAAGIYNKKALQKNSFPLNWKDQKILCSCIYALVSTNSDNEESITQFLMLNNLQEGMDFYAVTAGIWIFKSDSKGFQFPDVFTNTCLFKITDVHDRTYRYIGKILKHYRNSDFFYDYNPLQKVCCKNISELKKTENRFDDASLDTIKAEWLSLKWIHDKTLFDKMKFDLKNFQFPFSALYQLLIALENKWNLSYSEITGQTIKLPTEFYSWTEVECWLIQVYEKTNDFHIYSRYPSDITKNILSCKQYIDNHFSSALSATEMAKNSHMSCGYFSRCFRDIVGMAFSDYYIHVRIRHAKELLLYTTNPIQQIAYDVGYNDEKYFSRLFKQITDYSPSDFREKFN